MQIVKIRKVEDFQRVPKEWGYCWTDDTVRQLQILSKGGYGFEIQYDEKNSEIGIHIRKFFEGE